MTNFVKFHFDGAGELRIGLLRREELVQRADAIALDDDFAHHVELDVVVGCAELGDLRVAAGFLTAELVGRHADNGETVLSVFLVQLLQLFVLRRVAALAGYVDEHHDLAFILRQIDFFAVEGLHFEVEYGRHFLVSFILVIRKGDARQRQHQGRCRPDNRSHEKVSVE